MSRGPRKAQRRANKLAYLPQRQARSQMKEFISTGKSYLPGLGLLVVVAQSRQSPRDETRKARLKQLERLS